jgi:protein-tyrosine-phosphatase
MRVTVVCRMNQVRSVFSEILLRSQYPDIEVSSAGIESVAGKLPITSVALISAEWGLNSFNLKPKEILEVREFIESSDLLLLAENSFSKYFSDWNLKAKVRSFDEFTSDQNFVPKDPVDLSDGELKVELAKIGYVAIRAIELERMTPSVFPIKVIIPLNASDAELAFTHARFESKLENGFLIDIDFRSPNAREFATQEECVYFDPENFNAENYQTNESRRMVFTPDREYRVPEKILISREFRNTIREFARVAPVILISAPRQIQGVPIPDSYLAAISANCITTVGC